MTIRTIASAFGAAWLCAAASANAAPITHFSYSVTVLEADSRNCGNDSDCYRAPEVFEAQFDAGGGAISAARNGEFFEGTATATAQGNLSGGELKAFSEVRANGNNGRLSSFSRIDIGDSFRTFSGNDPFTWESDTEVGFSFDVSGLADFSGATNGSRLNLSILAPGDLDRYGQWLNGDAPNSPDSLIDFSYNLGEGGTVYPWTTDTITEFPDTISATFTPGGDFDWVMTLITSTQVNTTTFPEGFGLSDFSSTVIASYAGPDGGTTFSASGLFPGTLALSGAPVSEIPIPGAIPLLLSGLAGLGLISRKKKARTAASPSTV